MLSFPGNQLLYAGGRGARSAGIQPRCCPQRLCDILVAMRTTFLGLSAVLLLALPLPAQEKRLWVLRAPDELVEYDLATFAAKLPVKVPAEALKAPQSLAVNHLGQVLFTPTVSLPLADSDVDSPHKVWLWNGHAASTIDLGVKRTVTARGSNQVVAESAPAAYLAADGAHLFWSANQARRLAREDVDLSTETTWQAWLTDLTGGAREELAAIKSPDCRCLTGACEESCPYSDVWTPDDGVEKVVLTMQIVAAKTGTVYKPGSRCQEEAGKWTCTTLTDPLHRVLDAASDGNMIVEAIPDTACCGWSNQSDDQALVRANGKTLIVFDELATYKNSDYDVSFYSSNARLSPALGFVAMTITSSTQANGPIQLAEGGTATPEEAREIRKALADLPVVEVKSLEDSPRRVALVPHAALAGWITEKEILIVENHVLVVYNVATGARRKSPVHVDDAARVFLR